MNKLGLIPIKYKGVDIAKVLAIPIYGRILINIYKSIFHYNAIGPSRVDSDILIIYSHLRSKRKDYFQIINTLYSIVQKNSSELVVMQPAISILDKIFLIKHFISSLVHLKDVKGGVFFRLYLIILISRVKTNIDYLADFLEKSEFRILVTFCDAHDIDNILTQLAKNMGKVTITLQHGQYCIASYDTPENMALENLTSDYICAWGDATRDEYAMLKNRITEVVPLGTLRTYSEGIKLYFAGTLEESAQNSLVCIMLNADGRVKDNIMMIEIIGDFCSTNSYRYCVRFHPNNNKLLYTNSFDKTYIGEYVDSMASDISFSVIYTSGVVVELLLKGQLFFLYKNENTPRIFRNNMLNVVTFESSRDLSKKSITIFSNAQQCAIKLNNLRQYFCDPGRADNNYLSFFRSILSKIGSS
jgi:hypothetical protein